METLDFEIFTADYLKKNLGRSYLAKVHAKAGGATYQQIRDVLNGEGTRLELVKSVMLGAKAALEEKIKLQEINSKLSPKKAA